MRTLRKYLLRSRRFGTWQSELLTPELSARTQAPYTFLPALFWSEPNSRIASSLRLSLLPCFSEKRKRILLRAPRRVSNTAGIPARKSELFTHSSELCSFKLGHQSEVFTQRLPSIFTYAEESVGVYKFFLCFPSGKVRFLRHYR